MKNHPVVPVKMNKLVFIYSRNQLLFLVTQIPLLSVYASLDNLGICPFRASRGNSCFFTLRVFKPQLLWEDCSISDIASTQSRRWVDPLMSFHLLEFARPGAALSWHELPGSVLFSCSLGPQRQGRSCNLLCLAGTSV